MDTSRYTIHADQSHVSVKVHVLTDLYPLIQSSLRCPPFADGGPPKLLYQTGPWTGDNICTALECFFQCNAYHPRGSWMEMVKIDSVRRNRIGRWCR